MKIFPPHPSNIKKTLTFLALSFLLFAIYSNSFDCGWHFDDFPNITQNSNVQPHSLSWAEIKKSFHGTDSNAINRPLSFLTLALNYYFHQDNVLGYHVVNLLIHFLSTVFLFLCIQQAISASSTCKFNKTYAYHIALLASFIWAIHPIQVTAVTYIVQRMASLAGLFSIASLYFYLLARSNQAAHKTSFFLFAFLAALLAFASKENSFMLPIVILAAELILIQGFSKKTLLKNYKLLLGFTIAALLFIVFQDLDSIVAGYSTRPFSLLERLLTQPRVILKYLYLIFCPIDQNFALLHDIEYSNSLFYPWTTIPAFLALLSTLLIALMKAGRYPLISFSIIFFFLNHLIESSIVPLEMIFEHRNYLPSMFIFVPPAIIIIRLYHYFSDNKNLQQIYLLFAIAVFLLVGYTTHARNNILKDEISLWQDNINKYPNLIRPYIDIGKAYFDEKQYAKAIESTKAGLSATKMTKKNYPEKILYNLGLQYMAVNQLENAEIYLHELIKLNPNNAKSYAALAQIKFDQGDDQESLDLIKKALSLNKTQGQYHYLQARILTRSGLPENAIKSAITALKLSPENKLPIYVMGEAYRLMNDLNKATQHYLDFNNYYPDNIDARIALLEILYLEGKTEYRDEIHAEIVSLLKGTIFQKALHNFNNEFDLLNKRRDKTITAASKAAEQGRIP